MKRGPLSVHRLKTVERATHAVLVALLLPLAIATTASLWGQTKVRRSEKPKTSPPAKRVERTDTYDVFKNVHQYSLVLHGISSSAPSVALSIKSQGNGSLTPGNSLSDGYSIRFVGLPKPLVAKMQSQDNPEVIMLLDDALRINMVGRFADGTTVVSHLPNQAGWLAIINKFIVADMISAQSIRADVGGIVVELGQDHMAAIRQFARDTVLLDSLTSSAVAQNAVPSYGMSQAELHAFRLGELKDDTPHIINQLQSLINMQFAHQLQHSTNVLTLSLVINQKTVHFVETHSDYTYRYVFNWNEVVPFTGHVHEGPNIESLVCVPARDNVINLMAGCMTFDFIKTKSLRSYGHYELPPDVSYQAGMDDVISEFDLCLLFYRAFFRGDDINLNAGAGS